MSIKIEVLLCVFLVFLIKSSFKIRVFKLSEEKTTKTTITDGFHILRLTIQNFYSKNINVKGQRGAKTDSSKFIICPSIACLKKYREELKLVFYYIKGTSVTQLFARINFIVRGWSNYFISFCLRKSFEKLNTYFYVKLYAMD